MVENPACSSQNHHPDMKDGAEGPAFGPSPCRLLVGTHSQADFENVAPTAKLHHDPEGGNLADQIHQIGSHALRNSVKESLLETRKKTR